MPATAERGTAERDELSSEQINDLATSVEQELKKFKLESFHSERLISALHDYEHIYDKVRKASAQTIDVACDVEKFQDKEEVYCWQ